MTVWKTSALGWLEKMTPNSILAYDANPALALDQVHAQLEFALVDLQIACCLRAMEREENNETEKNDIGLLLRVAERYRLLLAQITKAAHKPTRK